MTKICLETKGSYYSSYNITQLWVSYCYCCSCYMHACTNVLAQRSQALIFTANFVAVRSKCPYSNTMITTEVSRISTFVRFRVSAELCVVAAVVLASRVDRSRLQ